MIRIILAASLYIGMVGVMVCIGYLCWKDSKDDFKEAFRYAAKCFKKKKAD